MERYMFHIIGYFPWSDALAVDIKELHALEIYRHAHDIENRQQELQEQSLQFSNGKVVDMNSYLGSLKASITKFL